MHPGNTVNMTNNGNIRRAFRDVTNASNGTSNGAHQIKKNHSYSTRSSSNNLENMNPNQFQKTVDVTMNNSIREIHMNTDKHIISDENERTMMEEEPVSYQYSAPADNIDERDMEDPLYVTDYVEELYVHFRKKETQIAISPDYMSAQPHINEKMRSILIDWLVEVHLKFKLVAETLYLTTNLIDRYLEVEEVTRGKLQLVGVTCLLIASKYEEIYPPELRDLVYICDRAYSKEEILDMEEVILKALNYRVTIPSAHAFLVRYLKAAHADKKMVQLSCYLLDGTLQCYNLLQFLPSELAAAVVMIARTHSNRNSWSPTLLKYANYCEEDIIPVAKAILKEKAAVSHELRAVTKKYSASRYGGIASLHLSNQF